MGTDPSVQTKRSLFGAAVQAATPTGGFDKRNVDNDVFVGPHRAKDDSGFFLWERIHQYGVRDFSLLDVTPWFMECFFSVIYIR